MPHYAVNYKLAFVAVLSTVVLGNVGISQALAQVPNSVNPGLIEQRLAPVPKPTPSLKLKTPAPAESQEISAAQRAKLESSKFGLKKVVLEGATVYKSADLASTYNDQIGKTISLLDARGIANRITTFYRNKGYILSQAVVPPQDVTGGVLKIRVIEGFISNVTYQGDVDAEGVRERLDGYADSIKNLRPANMADLERYMLLMNDLPGSTITGLIHPSASQFAGADLVLTVRRRTYEGSYTFDNRGTRFLGPFQHTAVLGANSVFNTYDHTQVRIMTVDPFRELLLGELQHDEILNNEGTKLSFLASETQTRPGDTLKYLRIKGNSSLFEAKVSHPFLRSRQQSLVARALFDVRNTGVDILSGDAYTRDRLRIARVGGTYSFIDLLQGSDAIDVQLSQGMDIFDATNKGGNRSNPIGSSSFTKANFDMSRLQPLSDGFSILTAAIGQFSFEPLLTDEQFSLGGADYGRAFDPAEALGDSGLGGKAEVRYDGFVGNSYFDSYQLFTYVDIGEAWTRGVANGNSSVSSTGLGARLRLTDNFSGAVEADFPLMWTAPDASSYRTNPRLFFSVTARF